MKEKFRAPRRALVAIVAIAALAAVAALAAASSSNAAGPVTHPIKVQPEISSPQTKPNGATQFGCQQRPLSGTQGLRCYSPAQIQTAYGVNGLLAQGIDGTGRTIVIIDAYSNPYVANDLAMEDAEFGLPAADFSTVSDPSNPPPAFDVTDPNQAGWAEEITLDVLWAHAMAPGAKIVLAEAKSNNDDDIFDVTKYVIDNNLGDVISQSFGEAETCVAPSILDQEHALFQKANDEGITVFASSGDSGASQFNCDGTAAILSASSPASDPNVTGVGGTTLHAADLTGAYGGETAWTESLLGCNPPALDFPVDVNCSGGGYSTIYSRPSWQQSLAPQQGPSQTTAGRGVPDVAYNAGVNGGVLTHCGVCNILNGLDPAAPAFFLFGGTSAGSPQWAALAADADQLGGHRMGNINDDLYQLSGPGQYARNFHDVTKGNNDVAEIGTGYDTTNGWDAVTGLGTPNAANLLPALAASTK